MTKYAADHAGALADLAADGVAVSFAYTVAGPYTPDTDTAGAATTTTVTGSAVQVTPDRRQFAALNLVEGRTVALFFAPTTFGSLPVLGSTFSFGGETFVVRSVDPLAPAGTAIAATIVGAR